MIKTITITATALLMASTAHADVPYITGGVGKTEREMIQQKTQSGMYNLEIKTALHSGHYLGDVAITITDNAGTTVLNATTDGPLFFAKLKPGTYHISGNYNGQKQSQKTTIHENTKMREVMLRFKDMDNDERDAPM